MTWVVLDASAVAAWVFPSQSTASSRRFLEDLDRHRLAAPYIFRWEVANMILVTGPTRGIDVETALAEVERLEVSVADPVEQARVFELTAFAVEADLSLFDAAYLGLAMEMGAALASRDGPLIDAACAVGVDVFDLRD